MAHVYRIYGTAEDTMPSSAQWVKWLAAAGFSKAPFNYHQPIDSITDWQGFDRNWRINIRGQMQVSEKHAEFVHWANSVFYTTQGVPQTQEEFLERTQFMLKCVERKERLIKLLCNKEHRDDSVRPDQATEGTAA